MSKIPLTLRGVEKLREELKRLKSVERPAIVKAIAEARAHGDISENAEFHAAKEQQGFIEGRIAALEHKLATAQVVDVTKVNAGGKVVFGATVKIADEDGKESRWQIVGEDEADSKSGLISINSPIARALIGRKEGDVVEVAAPGGPITLVAVHTLQPLADVDVLRRQLRALDELRAALRRDDRQMVLAGDFNATSQHRGFRRLLDHGLRDAHRERGRGRVRTWPDDRWYPPFAALDHVLVSGGIAVEDAGTAGIPGSDHRAVTATLSV